MKNPLHSLVARIMLPGQRMRASQFEKFPLVEDDIVFLGDSITEQGIWGEWFPSSNVRNRGIGGDVTSGVLERLHSAVPPRAGSVFILIGTNDLGRGLSPSETAANLGTILANIAQANPTVALYVQSVMPRSRKYRARILELNQLYRDIAAEAGVIWIDLWPALASPEGDLRNEFTLDGLHLSGEGYAAWADVMRPHVERASETV